MTTCPGPLIWYGTTRDHEAILRCAGCDYIVVTGNFNDPSHAETPILREGLR